VRTASIIPDDEILNGESGFTTWQNIRVQVEKESQ
jgi:hypothetical protein